MPRMNQRSGAARAGVVIAGGFVGTHRDPAPRLRGPETSTRRDRASPLRLDGATIPTGRSPASPERARVPLHHLAATEGQHGPDRPVARPSSPRATKPIPAHTTAYATAPRKALSDPGDPIVQTVSTRRRARWAGPRALRPGRSPEKPVLRRPNPPHRPSPSPSRRWARRCEGPERAERLFHVLCLLLQVCVSDASERMLRIGSRPVPLTSLCLPCDPRDRQSGTTAKAQVDAKEGLRGGRSIAP